jgi:hypothetical protein
MEKDLIAFLKIEDNLNSLVNGRQSQKNYIKTIKLKAMVVAPLRVT